MAIGGVCLNSFSAFTFLERSKNYSSRPCMKNLSRKKKERETRIGCKIASLNNFFMTFWLMLKVMLCLEEEREKIKEDGN